MQPEHHTLCMWCQWALGWNWDKGYLRVVTSDHWSTAHLVEGDSLRSVCRRIRLEHSLRPVADYHQISA